MNVPRLVFCVLAWATGPVAASAQSRTIESVLERVGEIRLEEAGEHLVAMPRMTLDPRGGWIYWDQQSGDIRLYDPVGRLRNAFGRKGEGPGEFQRVVGAVRLGDGRIAALDDRGRISVWTAAGDSLVDDFNCGVSVPRGLVALGTDQVVVYGRPQARGTEDFTAPVLHLVSVAGRKETDSFFQPPLTASTFTAARGVESPPPLVRNDTVFVALVPFDSLWAVAANAPHGQRSIPIRSPAILATPAPEMAAQGRAQYHAWVGEATFPGRFAGLPDGGWLIQTWGLRADGPVRGLTRLDKSGELVWEVAGTPELLAVHPTTGDILLWNPSSLDPAVVEVLRESEARDSSQQRLEPDGAG